MLTSRGPVEDNKLTVHVMSEVGVTKSLSQFSDSAEANDIRLIDAGRSAHTYIQTAPIGSNSGGCCRIRSGSSVGDSSGSCSSSGRSSISSKT